MKRLSVALLLCGALSTTTILTAQSNSSTPSRFTISTGIGLFPTYYKASESTGLPPIMIKAGIDVSKKFSVGAFYGYSSTTSTPKIFSELSDSYLTNKTTVAGLRFEVRSEQFGKLQTYGGSMLGLNHAKVREYNNSTKALVVRDENEPTPFNPNEKNVKMVYSAFLGLNYHIAKRVNIYGELGYGISVANIGVTVRI